MNKQKLFYAHVTKQNLNNIDAVQVPGKSMSVTAVDVCLIIDRKVALH